MLVFPGRVNGRVIGYRGRVIRPGKRVGSGIRVGLPGRVIGEGRVYGIKATWSKGQSQRHDQERRATLESKNKDAIYSKCFRHSNVLDPRLSPKHKEAIYSNLETFKIAVPRDVACIGSFQLTQKTSKMEYKASESVLQTINPQTGECKANDAPLIVHTIRVARTVHKR
ncbi:hypothetical protein ACFE04_019866 [Oxalis oulophora]